MMHLFVTDTVSWAETLPDEFLDQPAVFESIRTYSGKIFWLDQHVERIQSSARVLGISCEIEPNEIQEQIQEVRDKNYVDTDLKIKVQLNNQGYAIMASSLDHWSESYYTEGVSIGDVIFERSHPEAKYTTPVYQEFLSKGEAMGVQEIIFFDQEGNLREGNRTNVFAVYGETIRTPKDKILKGVMRRQVLEMARNLGLKVQEGDISRETLAQADEILLTNALKGIIPVCKWNNWERKSSHVYKSLSKMFDKKMK